MRCGPAGAASASPRRCRRWRAFGVALDLYDAEGGQPARLARYRRECAGAVRRGAGAGPDALSRAAATRGRSSSPCTSRPTRPSNLQRFVDALKARGVLISNFCNTKVPTFRVGCIGAVTPDDMRGAVAAIGAALEDLGVRRREAA